MIHRCILVVSVSLLLAGCVPNKPKDALGQSGLELAAHQLKAAIHQLPNTPGIFSPRTVVNGKVSYIDELLDWTIGFFPGTLWYMYDFKKDDYWKQQAERFTNAIENAKFNTAHHDVGFVIQSSFGHGYRLTRNERFKDVIIQAARSLSTRFDSRVGCILSWDADKGWQGERGWQYPVIIDNMMNLELLFYASRVTGDPRLFDLSVTHSYTTLKNHFREDFSTYHVVDYDSVTGEVRHKVTSQGLSDNSTWSRGQAWGIYGFTMTYRETKNPDFLNAAVRAADMYLSNLPEDLIPYWDFNVGQEGFVPRPRSHASQFQEKIRDASAAAIVTSALFELSELANEPRYYDYAVRMLRTLASPAYRAELGTNGNFILKHCVGSIPHRSEIDVPLVYADYYFLEALIRYKNSRRPR